MGAVERAWRWLGTRWARQPVPVDQISMVRYMHDSRAMITGMRTDLAECRAQLAAHEAEAAAARRDVFAMLDLAAKAAGGHPDLETTMPRGLYAVRDEQQAG